MAWQSRLILMDGSDNRDVGAARSASAAFRAAMQHFCGAVTVVSTEHEGHDFGMTATAVCSISDTPPMVMVCINKTASIHQPLLETGRCTISILNESNIEVAQKFSSKDENMRRERLKHFTGRNE